MFCFCILGVFPLPAPPDAKALTTRRPTGCRKRHSADRRDVPSGRISVYAAMKAPWCFGMEFTFDVCSDLADGTSPWADISRGTAFSSASGGVQNHWQNLYELVHRANTVIRKVAGMPISGETIDRVTGEAKFLRAMAYFRMLNCWGGVPYYDETCDINEQFANLRNPRSTAEEIRRHVIEDLDDAIRKLPVRWDAENQGEPPEARRTRSGEGVPLRPPMGKGDIRLRGDSLWQVCRLRVRTPSRL